MNDFEVLVGKHLKSQMKLANTSSVFQFGFALTDKSRQGSGVGLPGETFKESWDILKQELYPT